MTSAGRSLHMHTCVKRFIDDGTMNRAEEGTRDALLEWAWRTLGYDHMVGRDDVERALWENHVVPVQDGQSRSWSFGWRAKK